MLTLRSSASSNFLSTFIYSCLLALLAFGNIAYAGPATDLSQQAAVQQQRQTFLAAKSALDNTDWDQYAEQRQQLQSLDYVLTPYLDYLALRKKLSKSNSPADSATLRSLLDNFKTQAQTLSVSQRLQKSWASYLARSGQWRLYQKEFAKIKKPSNWMKCKHARAEIELNGRIAKPQKIISDLWMVSGSQSNACDPVFEHLFQYNQISDKQVWQRFKKSINAGKTSVAEYLLKNKLAKKYHPQAKRWINLYKKPMQAVEQAIQSPKLYSRSMMVVGMKKVANDDAAQAQRIWPKLQQRYAFTKNEKQKVQAKIGLHSALQKLPNAEAELSKVAGAGLNRSLREWRVRNAIQNYDWPQVSYWISQLTSKEQKKWRWRYWAARAQEEQGNTAEANREYRVLAKDRGYYSWLAADRLGIPYNIQHETLAPDESLQTTILQNPNIRSAIELHIMQLPTFAKSLWNTGISGMSKAELKQAALIAQEVDWPNQAIRTLSKARVGTDQTIRYPIAYSDHLKARAQSVNIEPAWVYGLMRAESLFETTAKSPVGARGLMQLMPATGKKVAQQLGMPLANTEELYDSKINMTLGTQYLADMLQRFNGNMVLATAAYNAGPHRVEKWLPESGNIPADIWADTIPFYETRNYITKVMSYAAMFDWRLKGGTQNAAVQPTRLSTFMQPILPDAR